MNNVRHDDTGTFLPLLAIALIALMGISFYAIDMGMMFKARNQLQVATDAALTRALQMISSNPALSQEYVDEVILMSELVAIDNIENNKESLNLQNWNPDENPPVTIDIEFDPIIKVTATGSILVDTWLLDALPMNANEATIGASAEGEKKRLIVAMVLDVSESMKRKPGRCVECNIAMRKSPSQYAQLSWNRLLKYDHTPLHTPLDDIKYFRGDFPPSPPSNGGGGGGGGGTYTPPPSCQSLGLCIGLRKMEYMKAAADNFVSNFFPFIERLHLVSFGNGSNYLNENATTSDKLSEVRSIISSLSYQPNGGTNMSAALELAREKILETRSEGPEWEDAFGAIILITDGIPGTCESSETCKVSASCVADQSDTYNYDKAPYMAYVVNLSDSIRDDRITIFSIGVGRESTDSSSVWQNRFDGVRIKPYFMRRISNDPNGINDPRQFDDSNPPAMPSCLDFTYNDIADNREGVYIVSNGADISPILDSFGEKILTQITK